MKRSYRLKNLDCAVCAAKMEDAVKKIDGVRDASISFMAERLVPEADDENFASVIDEAVRRCKKIEPDCEIVR